MTVRKLEPTPRASADDSGGRTLVEIGASYGAFLEGFVSRRLFEASRLARAGTCELKVLARKI